jgi:UPF0755 protein
VRGASRLYLTVALACIALVVGGASASYRFVDDQVHQARRVGQPALALTIPPSSSISEIGKILRHNGLVDNTLAFEFYVRVLGHSKLEAGNYEVPGGYSTAEVVALLEHDTRGRELLVTVPEGLTDRQIGQLLQDKGLFSADAYLAAQKAGTFPQGFLAGHQHGTDLEGYLFPDTYFLARKATPSDVINLQLQRFGQVVPAALRARASAHNITFAQAIVLASIVEREAKFPADRPQIAAVFYNRLARGMPLEADATLLYARGVTTGPVTDEDKAINSPYNTYRNNGIPPGPISNPGLAAISAVLMPASNDYLYYLTDSSGRAHFSRSFQEHEQCQVNVSSCPTAQ